MVGMAYNQSIAKSRRATAGAAAAAPPQERVVEEQLPVKSAVGSVTNVYQACIAGFWRNVTVQWFKNLMNISFSITVDGESSQTCKVELKPWHFWSKKGYKTFEIDAGRPHNHHQQPSSGDRETHLLEVYWDLRTAKFASGPEPIADYYVAVVSDEENALLLGDNKKKAYKRTKKRPALVESVQSLKREVVYAKKSFSTRARFAEGRGEHDVVVESSITGGSREPEMWISVDGIVLVHVKNLQWKFRGNETVMVNKQPIQVFWDVHAWLFAAPGSGCGLFIFKPGAPETESDKEDSSRGSDSSTGSLFYSTASQSKAPDFCLFLNAWKMD